MRVALACLFLSACSAGVLGGDPAPTPTPEPGPDPGLAAAEALYREDHLVEVEITMDPADAAALAAETNTFFSLLEGEDCMDSPWGGAFSWYPADVRVDGVLYEQVGVRKKGLLGSLSDTRPSFKVKFDKYVEGQLLDGLERLTLNNSISDPSLVRQCLGYALFRAADLPAPRCNFAHVVANGQDLGVYVNVEPVKKTFLRWAWDGDADGDLYEGTLSDFRPGWTETFEPDTGDTDPDRGPVHAVTDALRMEDDAAMLAALAEVLDLDAFRRFWAMEALIAHWDGYSGNRNNFYVYVPEGTGRMEFVPWGIDGVLRSARGGQGQEPVVFGATLLARRLWAIESERAAYLDALEDHLDRVWDAEALVAEVDRMSGFVAPFAHPDERRAADLSALRRFLRERRATLEASIAAGLPDFDEPLPGNLCLVPRGELRVDFQATWDTLGAEDVLGTGTGLLSGTWDQTPFALEGGALAGLADNTVLVAAQALSSQTTVAQAIVAVPAWALQAARVPVDGLWTRVYVRSFDFSTGQAVMTPLGTMWSGELVFTALQAEAGGRVAGWVEGPIYSGGPF